MQIAKGLNRPLSYPRALVISVHDVHPGTFDVVRDILMDLRREGASKISLLTVPDYHNGGDMSTCPDFCKWLREQCAVGHEAVLHGYFHLRELKKEEKLQKRFITQAYTAGEGEFYDLQYEEARERLERGREVFAVEGIPSEGFIAPAWLLGGEAERAVADAGFRYTVRLASVTDFQTGRIHSTYTLAYSARAVWRRATSLVWNPLLWRFCASQPLLRISIHPPDWKFPALRTQILRLAAESLAVRSPMTYQEWVRLSASYP